MDFFSLRGAHLCPLEIQSMLAKHVHQCRPGSSRSFCLSASSLVTAREETRALVVLPVGQTSSSFQPWPSHRDVNENKRARAYLFSAPLQFAL